MSISVFISLPVSKSVFEEWIIFCIHITWHNGKYPTRGKYAGEKHFERRWYSCRNIWRVAVVPHCWKNLTLFNPGNNSNINEKVMTIHILSQLNPFHNHRPHSSKIDSKITSFVRQYLPPGCHSASFSEWNSLMILVIKTKIINMYVTRHHSF